jgi:DNA polymerase III sliding clamp (beta) subunit (PCNA family)
MYTRVLVENLQEALKGVKAIVPTKPLLPILKGIKLTGIDNELIITASNLETTYQITLTAKVNQPGECVVNFADGKLLKLINSYKKCAVELELTDKGLILTAHDGVKHILKDTYPVSEYPIATIENWQKVAVLDDSAQFAHAYTLAAKTRATEDNRPILQAIRMEVQSDKVRFVTSDAFRLSVSSEITKNDGLTVTTAQNLPYNKAIAQLAGSVTIETGSCLSSYRSHMNNYVRFTTGKQSIIVETLDGVFPDYAPLIPAHMIDVHINSSDAFSRALSLCKAIASESVILTITPDQNRMARLTLAGKSQEKGDVETLLDASTALSSTYRSQFSLFYLLDALKGVNTKFEDISLLVNPDKWDSLLGVTYADGSICYIMPQKMDEEKPLPKPPTIPTVKRSFTCDHCQLEFMGAEGRYSSKHEHNGLILCTECFRAATLPPSEPTPVIQDDQWVKIATLPAALFIESWDYVARARLRGDESPFGVPKSCLEGIRLEIDNDYTVHLVGMDGFRLHTVTLYNPVFLTPEKTYAGTVGYTPLELTGDQISIYWNETAKQLKITDDQTRDYLLTSFEQAYAYIPKNWRYILDEQLDRFKFVKPVHFNSGIAVHSSESGPIRIQIGDVSPLVNDHYFYEAILQPDQPVSFLVKQTDKAIMVKQDIANYKPDATHQWRRIALVMPVVDYAPYQWADLPALSLDRPAVVPEPETFGNWLNPVKQSPALEGDNLENAIINQLALAGAAIESMSAGPRKGNGFYIRHYEDHAPLIINNYVSRVQMKHLVKSLVAANPAPQVDLDQTSDDLPVPQSPAQRTVATVRKHRTVIAAVAICAMLLYAPIKHKPAHFEYITLEMEI